MKKVRSQRKRALAAFCLVGACALSLPAADAIAKAVQSTSRHLDILLTGSTEGLLPEAQSLPEDDFMTAFCQEAFDVRGYDDLRYQAESGLLGFSCQESAKEALRGIKEHLAERGWGCTDGGLDTFATFGKEEGKLRWLYVSCTDVSGQSSVVVYGM